MRLPPAQQQQCLATASHPPSTTTASPRSLQEKFNRLSQSRAISSKTLGAVLHVLQQAAQGPLGSSAVTIAAYQPLQVPQHVSGWVCTVWGAVPATTYCLCVYVLCGMGWMSHAGTEPGVA